MLLFKDRGTSSLDTLVNLFCENLVSLYVLIAKKTVIMGFRVPNRTLQSMNIAGLNLTVNGIWGVGWFQPPVARFFRETKSAFYMHMILRLCH